MMSCGHMRANPRLYTAAVRVLRIHEYQLTWRSRIRLRSATPVTSGTTRRVSVPHALRSTSWVSFDQFTPFSSAPLSPLAASSASASRRRSRTFGKPPDVSRVSPVARFTFHAWIATPTAAGPSTSRLAPSSWRNIRMMNWNSISTATARADRPLSVLLFFQKFTSLRNARNSKSRCSTLATMVTESISTDVSATRRRTSSTSSSLKPISLSWPSSESTRKSMRRNRESDMWPTVSLSGSDAVVLFSAAYLSLVSPTSSACMSGWYTCWFPSPRSTGSTKRTRDRSSAS
mmetsp:Transcript_44748/g.140314  ORF Transcript_44748/g.140314 Transcript_44748/m.140314 type:complete len:289 (-) Transcript_44748:858-1724(-)